MVLSVKEPESTAPRNQRRSNSVSGQGHLKFLEGRMTSESLFLSNIDGFLSEYITTAHYPAELLLPTHITGLGEIPSIATRSLQLNTEFSTTAPQF